MTLICYPRCSTCKKAEKWLAENGIEYVYRDIQKENPNAAELKKLHKRSGLPIKRIINTSGMKYRELSLKDKLPTMSDADIYALLATDGLLVKRPILVSDDFVLFGFKEAEWQERLGV